MKYRIAFSLMLCAAPAAAQHQDLVDVIGLDPTDRTCQDTYGPGHTPKNSDDWVQCKAREDAMDARAQAVWDGWTPDQRTAFLARAREMNAKPGINPPILMPGHFVGSEADYQTAAIWGEIAACRPPGPNPDYCP